ncbi:MAG: DUF192 domain-containing protein [Spirochaetes bacterium]|nr:DUF192 domain-containing protein [Spirochaetota bacterium]
MFGLIPYHEIKENEVFLIENCSSIHTFFMKFNIDVVFTDKKGKIIKLEKDMKPWRILNGGLKAGHVYEWTCGSISKYHIKEGKDIKPWLQKN